MEATEVKDMIDEAVEREHVKEKGSKTSTAIYISVLAAVLSVVSVMGSNASKEMMASAIEASDTFAYYQAKTQRQVSLRLAADQLELLTDGMPDAIRSKAEAKIAEYRKNADRADSPTEDNNRQSLIAKARDAEHRRDHAAAQDPYFDFAEALLQIAIVLASVFVITDMALILLASRILGAVGVLLALDGITQWIPLPFL
ncbi:DUF4337 domain-containing protein [Azospirillum rugosum]|uniref:DUF4337 domain-containing protein n=1 Tax=Azospirillum rugosum TaxID=416170 RepID=A0ABS4SMJ9_9PROT|nr:DUF4337 domain-containing protein [Azospirillum rugosum]MBP2293152.1 hypothetical protein [Azospirillum rugosum]MDQ0526701.1 hypothetical protein [Azospirillum rugosum]